MRQSVAGAASLGLALVVAALAACSGEVGSSPTSLTTPTPSVTPTRVTIDDTGCSASGPLSFVAGPIRIEVANEAAELANFELLAFTPSGSYDALATHVAEEQARLGAGEDLVGPPAFVRELTRAEVEPGGAGELSAIAEPGVLAVVCALIDPDAPDEGIGLTGPYVVLEVP